MAKTACSVDIPIISSAFINDGVEILSSTKAPRYIDYINVLFGRVFKQEYLNNDSYLTLSDLTDNKSETTVNGKILLLYNKAKEEFLNDIKSDFYDTLKPEVVEDLNQILDNWDAFVNFHATKHNAFLVFEEEATEEKENFDKRGNEYSEFELTTNEVMTLFKFLPKVEYITDIRGNQKIAEAYDPITGLPTRADFENIYKLTLDALKGIKDEGEFIDVLTSHDLLKKVPELEFLFEILPLRDGGVENLQQKQRLLFNSFYTVFSRDYIPVHASITTLPEKEGDLPEHFRHKTAKGNSDKIERKFVSNFASDQTETEFVKIDNTEDEKAPQNAGNGRKRLYSLPDKSLLNKGVKIQLTEKEIEDITPSEIYSKYKNHFDFFKILGIEFSDFSLLKSNKDKMHLIEVLNSALDIHDNISDRLATGTKMYNPLADIKVFTKTRKDKKALKILPLRSIIRNIVRLEVKFSKISPTVMSRDPNGNKQSDISYSNVLSIASRQISKSNSLEELYNKSYFKKLRYNPLHNGSYVANNVIGKGIKYEIENYSGHTIRSEEDSVGSDTKSLFHVEKFKSDFNNLLGWGILNTPQLESKSGYFAIKFLDKNDDAILPFSKFNFEQEFLSNNGQFLNQIVSYLRGEVQRIKNYQEMKGSSHSVPEAYGQLHIFKDMITPKQLETLMAKDFDASSAIIQKIKPKIEKFFQAQLKDIKDYIEDNQIKNFISKEAIEKNGVTVELFKESPETVTDSLLRTFIANSFVHNVEFGIFISGDPLFFKDWHKRLGGIASTGTTPANTRNLRLYFNHPSEKLYWDNFSLRGILNQGQDKPVERRDNFEDFLSAVLKEDIVNSNTMYHDPQTALDYIHSVKLNTGKDITLEQAIKDLKIKDLSIKKGDGQGYLNLDAARELSIKQNTYKPQHEVSYKYEALVFKRDILERKLTPSEEALLTKLQNQIIKKPKKYALPVLKQTYYGTMANESVKLDAKVFDKFSLSILLPSVARNHPKLKKLLLAMAERQIHYVKYESGTKGYVRNVISNIDDLFNEKVELDVLQSELLKLQILPSKEEKTKTKIPTQMVKLIYTNLFDAGNSTAGAKKLRDLFLDNLNKIQSSNKEQVLSQLGFKVDEQGKINSWDKNKIIQKIILQINVQKLPSNLMEALKIDADGNFVNTLESSGVYQQVLNYVSGKMDSTLREFKVNGGDFVLLSDSMFDTPLKYLKLSKDRSTIESMETRVTLTQEFAKLLNLPDPSDSSTKIGSIERLNELLKKRDFVKKYEKELTITFSRPPVQGPNSMGVAIVTEFFYPTAGNIMVLPVEFMHQAGIDFDYDKEKVLLPSLSDEGIFLDDQNINKRLTELENEYQRLREIFDYIDEYLDETTDYQDYDDLRENLFGGDGYSKLLLNIFGVKEPQFIPEKLDELQDIAQEYMALKYKNRSIYHNNLLKTIIASLKQPEIFSELILPNTDTTVRPLAISNGEDIKNLNTLPIGNSVYTYFRNLQVFKMFNDAKALLGPFALQNTFSQLIAPLDIKMNLDYSYNDKGIPKRRVNTFLIGGEDRVISISKREDISGDNKQHLNSEFINATVDSAKDPYFANFMLSFDNINTFMFMFTMNYPASTIVDFTSSAIVRKYLDIKAKNPDLQPQDLYMQTLREAGFDPKTKSIHLEKIMELDELNIGKPIGDIKRLKSNNSLTKEQYKEDHIALLTNFVAMEQHSKQLSSYKSLFKNDTNKITSIFEMFSKEALRNNVIGAGMFSREDIEIVETQSSMTAFKNELLIEDVLKNVFPILAEDRVIKTLGNLFVQRKGSLRENDTRVLSQVITNDFIGSILFTFGSYKDQNIFEYGKDLVRKVKNKEGTHNTVLLERIQRFKQNPEYPDLLEKFPALFRIIGDVSVKPLKKNPVYNNKFGFNVLFDIDPNIPVGEKESYMTQFKQIVEGDFNTKSPETKEALINFIKDFFIAGLIQSGFNKTAISFLEYMPIGFIQELLEPALYYYNYEKDKEDKTVFNKFLERFTTLFKLNNTKYFPKSTSKDAVKNSHLGKQLKVGSYDPGAVDQEIAEEVNEEEILETEAPVLPTGDREFTYLGKTIKTEFNLGEAQKEALEKLIDFVNSNEEDIITLQGAAGTGKTSIIGYLQKYLGGSNTFAYLAPTHAATAELAFATVKTGNRVLPATLQSSLTVNPKTKKNVFTIKIQKRLSYNPIIVLDEASMIDGSDIARLEEAIEDIGGKLILLGDEKQISKVVKGDVDSKEVSPAFTDFTQINLNKIFRQSDDNLLSLLSMMREQNDFKLFKVPSSEKIKFVNKKEYNKELISDLTTNPENTTVISYTNSSVKGINNASRKVLGREGGTVVGDIIIGYLGYASKQIEKGDLANSISYTIEEAVKEGSKISLRAKSSKLSRLIELGIGGITPYASTDYYQMSSSDSLNFDELTKEDYKNNNESVSKIFRGLHKANEDYRLKNINYNSYLSILAGVSETLRKYSVGDDYIYNPETDQMENYDPRKHKGIKTNGQGSLLMNKDVDYGHAITIHKSQGATIENVYFDSSSLNAAQNTPIVDKDGKKITTEKQSLAYVAMSRSKNKLVVYEGDNTFEEVKAPKETTEAINENDKTIFGHSGIGKTFLRGKTDSIIDFDEDYKSKINTKYNLAEGFKARNEWRKDNEELWDKEIKKLWVDAKKESKKTGKMLFASDMILLREFPQDFDKVINISKDTFINRAKQRNDYTEGKTEKWKTELDKAISSINPSKIITTDKYLSDLITTEQQTDIYSQLGDKTQSENVRIESWKSLKDQKEPYTKAYGSIVHVISTRIPNSEEHFGNPFSHDPAGKTQGLIKTETIKEAVEKYIDWVISSQDARAKWIRQQLQSGELKDKPILYYKELGEPSHATALDYLINKYNWNTQKTEGKILLNKVGDKITLTYQAKYKVANVPHTISNIEETPNGYIVTLKVKTYNGTGTETVTIENGEVVSSTRRYGGKDLKTDLNKASYDFNFGNIGREYTPENIETLPENGIFVFGSNTEGRHGLGAALLAKQNFGAKQGQAEGLQGKSYAIITKDLTKPKDQQAKSIPLNDIGKGLQDLMIFAKENPDKKFFVVKLGSSLAGYEVSEIKNLFKQLQRFIPGNVILPKEYEVRDEEEVLPLVEQPEINIYSTEKNGFNTLSNLLNGPVTFLEVEFPTVEHLYQWRKADFAEDQEAADKIFYANSGFDAQKLSRTIKGLDSKEWDKVSSEILEDSMRLAFTQNKANRNLLLSTGDAILTHKAQANLGKWATEFPRILMKLRDEFKTGTPQAPNSLKSMLAEFVGQSGGANGADYNGWDQIGRTFGFTNFNHYYTGEKSSANAPHGNVELAEDSVEYQEGRFESAKAAAVTYGYQYAAMKDARLIRNWAQVKHSDAIFAIGTLVRPGEKLFPNIKGDTRVALVTAVTGGTGYAVQMAINHGKPVYVFDQQRGMWAKNINGVWSKATTPVLTTRYAAIGTRNLNEKGKQAIRDVYQNTLANLDRNKLTEEEQKNLDDLGFQEGECKI